MPRSGAPSPRSLSVWPERSSGSHAFLQAGGPPASRTAGSGERQGWGAPEGPESLGHVRGIL